LGFGSTARTMNEPVSWLNDGSAKLILPVCGNLVPSGCTISTVKSRFGGSITCFFANSSRHLAARFCDTLKVTQIGSIAAT